MVQQPDTSSLTPRPPHSERERERGGGSEREREREREYCQPLMAPSIMNYVGVRGYTNASINNKYKTI